MGYKGCDEIFMITMISRKIRGVYKIITSTVQQSFSAIHWKLGDKCLVLRDGIMSEAKIWELNQNENHALITFTDKLFDEHYGNVSCRVSKGGIQK